MIANAVAIQPLGQASCKPFIEMGTCRVRNASIARSSTTVRHSRHAGLRFRYAHHCRIRIARTWLRGRLAYARQSTRDSYSSRSLYRARTMRWMTAKAIAADTPNISIPSAASIGPRVFHFDDMMTSPYPNVV